ncbi:MAG: GGDEF domain-containing protein [Pseudomonadales bacterium]
MDTATQQKSRIYRIATTGVGIFVHLIVCWVVLSIGYLSIEPIQFIALVSLAAAGFLAFIVAVMMEWNLKLEDPDMSLGHMIWAVSIVVMTTYFVEEMKPLVALSGLAMIVVGANRLTTKEMTIFAIYGLSLYVVTVFYKSQFVSLSWITEAVVLIAFGLVLVFGPVLYRFEMSMIENILINKNEELTTALGRISELAVRDELTGVYNRRHLLEVLAQQKAIADRRKDYSFTICYVDLDFFKRVNDKFGHSTGDHVLRTFAEIASDLLREVDCVARIGGEEFVLVLGGTSQRDALVATERLSERLQDLQVSPIEPQYRITASIGVTGYRPAEDVETTMERADKALYDAKRTGRNKVVIADSDQNVSIV